MLPFFFAWIGGVIGYFVLKDRNRSTATNILIFGIIWTFAGALLVGVIFFVLFAFSVSRMGGIILSTAVWQARALFAQ